MNFYTDKIILISSGAVAKGSNLSQKLAESGAAKVIILDDLSVSYNWNIPNFPNILFVKGSITNDNDLKLVFHEKSTYIFHLEAFFVNPLQNFLKKI